jgi:hypothetical protein
VALFDFVGWLWFWFSSLFFASMPIHCQGAFGFDLFHGLSDQFSQCYPSILERVVVT